MEPTTLPSTVTPPATSLPLRVLYCHCTYANVVPKAVKEEVLRQLSESGIPFDAVPDLCELSARKDPCLKQLAESGAGEPLKIVACYPRAVKWLFNAAGTPLPPDTVEILNMRTDTAETVVNAVLGRSALEAEEAS